MDEKHTDDEIEEDEDEMLRLNIKNKYYVKFYHLPLL